MFTRGPAQIFEAKMLLAYIDEIGEPGAYVGPEHKRYNTSPAFGYAGFVLSDDRVRQFGAQFTAKKRELFPEKGSSGEQFEIKGADMFRPRIVDRYPQNVRVFNSLISAIARMGGELFYYAGEKPLGTPKQTEVDPEELEGAAMAQTLDRLARHAERKGENILVLIDQINEKTRLARLQKMYAHILGRATDHYEMRRIIEPPMHVDSLLCANIQMADWIAAIVSRAVDYQLVKESKHEWVTLSKGGVRLPERMFTHESKLHLPGRAVELHGAEIFANTRRVYGASRTGMRVHEVIDPAVSTKMRRVAEAAQSKKAKS